MYVKHLKSVLHMADSVTYRLTANLVAFPLSPSHHFTLSCPRVMPNFLGGQGMEGQDSNVPFWALFCTNLLVCSLSLALWKKSREGVALICL